MKKKSTSKGLLYLGSSEKKAHMNTTKIGCNVSNLMRRKIKRQNNSKMNKKKNKRPNKLPLKRLCYSSKQFKLWVVTQY